MTRLWPLALSTLLLTCGPASTPTPRARPSGRVVPQKNPPAPSKLVLPRLPPPSSAPASQAASQSSVQPVEELKKGALVRFHERLLQLEKKEIKRVRILHWGDSHVASDTITGTLRKALQARFGDAGPGFVLLGRPWRSYRHEAVRYGVSGRWRAERVHGRYSRRRPQPRDDHFGVAGVSVHARLGRAASAWAQPRRGGIDRADLYYLAHPRGGKLKLLVDGRPLRVVKTAASTPRLAVASVGDRAFRRIGVETMGNAEVRLFGVDLQRNTKGIVYDAMGINGARAEMQLHWGEATFAAMLRRLAPDLLIFAYGSNEVDAQTLGRARLTNDLRKVIERGRRFAPQADCLVLGPPDQARRVDPRKSTPPGRIEERAGQRWIIPDRLAEIIEAQRQAARQTGCAYWDQRAAMGGSGSIFDWRDAEPPSARADYVHFYLRGYQRLGRALYDALMASYRAFRLRRVLALTRPRPTATL